MPTLLDLYPGYAKNLEDWCAYAGCWDGIDMVVEVDPGAYRGLCQEHYEEGLRLGAIANG